MYNIKRKQNRANARERPLIMTVNSPEELPGYKKKSFLLPFGGGEIWFEHLDGIYGNEALVLKKLAGDRPTFCRPSYPSIVGFVVNETSVTDAIVDAIVDALLRSGKYFLRVCFIGTDKRTERALQYALYGGSFAVTFINDFEKAKEWLIPCA